MAKRLRKKNVISPSTYSLRNSETDLALAKPKTEYQKRTFGYSDSILRNNPPKEPINEQKPKGSFQEDRANMNHVVGFAP